MESGGKSRIVSGSQEVIGSIPICSTKIIRGLQILKTVALSFLPDFCQKGWRKHLFLQTPLNPKMIIPLLI
jgi:hypothetical protein